MCLVHKYINATNSRRLCLFHGIINLITRIISNIFQTCLRQSSTWFRWGIKKHVEIHTYKGKGEWAVLKCRGAVWIWLTRVFCCALLLQVVVLAISGSPRDIQQVGRLYTAHFYVFSRLFPFFLFFGLCLKI